MSSITIDIMNMLSDPLVFLDRRGAVTFSNQACQTLFSLSQQRQIFKKLRDIYLDFRHSGNTYNSEIPLSNFNICDHVFYVYIFALERVGSKERIDLALLKLGNSKTSRELSNTLVYLKGPLGEQELLPKRLNPEFNSLIGEDPKFRMALFKAQKTAGTDLPILISGESGTGKEKLAQIIHKIGYRREMPFVDINCAAIPNTLIESELFGYERGAFTGASERGKRGLFEEAHKGSIFLDEIGDTALSVQSKLLRVLEEGQFKRVGGTKNITVDTRVISATNKNLSDMINKKQFRDDLYYRLNTICLILPPLRDRGNDIRLLANFFLGKHSLERGESLLFSDESLDLMDSYNWPGNIRELRSVVDYAATMSETHEIGLESLPKSLFLQGSPLENKKRPLDQLSSRDTQSRLLPTIIRQVEKNLIQKALSQYKTKTEAINILGISRRTFYQKLKEHGLQ